MFARGSQTALQRTMALRRTYATAPPPPPKSGGSSLPLYVTILAGGLGALYFFSTPAERAKVDARAHEAAHRVEADVHDAKAAVERHASQAESRAEHLASDVSSKVREVSHDVTGYPRTTPERVADDARGWFGYPKSKLEREGKSLMQQASDEYEHDKAFASRKAHEARELAQRKAQEAKASGRSWWSWGQATAQDTADSVSRGASDAYNGAANVAQSAKDEGAAWWRWTSTSAQDGAQRAQEQAKYGLEKVETKVEHGAQHARDWTDRKL